MTLRALVLGRPPSPRLVDQLRSLGVEDVEVLSGGVAESLRAVASMQFGPEDAVVFVGADVFTHREALAGLLAAGTGVLAAEGGEGPPEEWPLRATRGRVESAGSPCHSVSRPTGTLLGVLSVAGPGVGGLADGAARLASLPGLAEGGNPARDVPALLTVALVRSGVHVRQADLRELYWARASTASDVARVTGEIEALDEDRLKLDSAVKPTDGFFTTFFVSPYSKFIARWAARRGLTPNVVTSVSMAVGVAAAACFAVGERWGLVAGAVLLQAAFTLDCVDGQLARYTRTFSRFGAWLDSMFDRGKEYVVFAGLALGASRAGDPLWGLAGAALTLQTVRHAFDFAWNTEEEAALEAAVQPPLEARADAPAPAGPAPAASGPAARAPAAPGPAGPAPAGSASTRLLARWLRLNRLPGMVWVKRVLVFPIGERFATISLTAALFAPRTTFVVLLAWGGAAGAYGLGGRVLRSVR